MHKEYLILWDNYVFYKDGRIYSKYYKCFLKGTVRKDGYVQVMLKCTDGKKRMFLWHRVIYIYFNGEIPEGYEVNHLDENKQNNRLSNLSLTSHIENCNYGTRNERCAAKHIGFKHTEEAKRKMINNPLRSKQVVAVDNEGNVVYKFLSIQEAGRQGFNSGCVSQCCNNCYYGSNIYKGLRWYYLEDYLKIKEVA